MEALQVMFEVLAVIGVLALTWQVFATPRLRQRFYLTARGDILAFTVLVAILTSLLWSIHWYSPSNFSHLPPPWVIWAFRAISIGPLVAVIGRINSTLKQFVPGGFICRREGVEGRHHEQPKPNRCG